MKEEKIMKLMILTIIRKNEDNENEKVTDNIGK